MIISGVVVLVTLIGNIRIAKQHRKSFWRHLDKPIEGEILASIFVISSLFFVIQIIKLIAEL